MRRVKVASTPTAKVLTLQVTEVILALKVFDRLSASPSKMLCGCSLSQEFFCKFTRAEVG